MTIFYGNAELPDKIYNRAMEYLNKRPDGHWIYVGAKSGKRNHPQIGCKALVDGKPKMKVVSVAKLLFLVQYNRFPYQLRRDKLVCKNPLCVNPDHFYAIFKPAPPRPDGKRNRNVDRVPVSSLGGSEV